MVNFSVNLEQMEKLPYKLLQKVAILLYVHKICSYMVTSSVDIEQIKKLPYKLLQTVTISIYCHKILYYD